MLLLQVVAFEFVLVVGTDVDTVLDEYHRMVRVHNVAGPLVGNVPFIAAVALVRYPISTLIETVCCRRRRRPSSGRQPIKALVVAIVVVAEAVRCSS